jgi:hypothetical protein
MGEVVLELVGPPDLAGGPAEFWGWRSRWPPSTRRSTSRARPRERLGRRQQPGRRIATVQPAAGLAVPVALMSDEAVG